MLFTFKHGFTTHSVFVACVAFFVLGHDFAATVVKGKNWDGQRFKNDVICLDIVKLKT